MLQADILQVSHLIKGKAFLFLISFSKITRARCMASPWIGGQSLNLHHSAQKN